MKIPIIHNYTNINETLLLDCEMDSFHVIQLTVQNVVSLLYAVNPRIQAGDLT